VKQTGQRACCAVVTLPIVPGKGNLEGSYWVLSVEGVGTIDTVLGASGKGACCVSGSPVSPLSDSSDEDSKRGSEVGYGVNNAIEDLKSLGFDSIFRLSYIVEEDVKTIHGEEDSRGGFGLPGLPNLALTEGVLNTYLESIFDLQNDEGKMSVRRVIGGLSGELSDTIKGALTAPLGEMKLKGYSHTLRNLNSSDFTSFDVLAGVHLGEVSKEYLDSTKTSLVTEKCGSECGDGECLERLGKSHWILRKIGLDVKKYSQEFGISPIGASSHKLLKGEYNLPYNEDSMARKCCDLREESISGRAGRGGH
jgi:hypothetical protein